jgi:hypothetical protein
MPQETTRDLAFIYYNAGPMCARVSQIADHTGLVNLCQQPLVRHTTQLLLQHMVSHSMKKAQLQGGAGVHINARVFLSGYMMLFFPQHAMDPAAEESAIVRSHAAALLQRFEQIIYALGARITLEQVPATLTQGFHILLANYNTAFSAWRTHDAERLVAQLYLERKALHAAVKTSHSKRETVRQIEVIRQKVRVLGGEAALRRMENELKVKAES